jgi:hypothetical protein
VSLDIEKNGALEPGKLEVVAGVVGLFSNSADFVELDGTVSRFD